jgi:CheY-like chemotaxis protein
VLCAESAVAAGHIVHERQPDLIVADIEMPYMDGIEFAQTVKADPATSSIPFIFVSANPDAEPQVRRVGAAAFVKKPLMPREFLAAVARHVGGPIAP